MLISTGKTYMWVYDPGKWWYKQMILYCALILTVEVILWVDFHSWSYIADWFQELKLYCRLISTVEVILPVDFTCWSYIVDWFHLLKLFCWLILTVEETGGSGETESCHGRSSWESHEGEVLPQNAALGARRARHYTAQGSPGRYIKRGGVSGVKWKGQYHMTQRSPSW